MTQLPTQTIIDPCITLYCDIPGTSERMIVVCDLDCLEFFRMYASKYMPDCLYITLYCDIPGTSDRMVVGCESCDLDVLEFFRMYASKYMPD